MIIGFADDIALYRENILVNKIFFEHRGMQLKKKKTKVAMCGKTNPIGFNIKTNNMHVYNNYNINNCLERKIIEDGVSLYPE